MLKIPDEWIAEVRARLDGIDRRRLFVAVAVLVAVGLVLAYCARPKPPKPADVKATVRVEKSVKAVEQERAEVLLEAAQETHHAVAKVRKQAAEAAEEIRREASSPTGDPYRAFYLRMCQSRFYRDAAECDGYRGGSEGGGSAGSS